jgi:hypothetical protein
MSEQFHIRVLRGQQVLQEHTLWVGREQALQLQAVPGVRYQVVSAETGFSPARLLLRRRGNALVIDVIDELGRPDSVEVLGYFEAEMQPQAMVGQNTDGDWVAYEAHPSHGLAEVADLAPGQTGLWQMGESVVAMGSGAVGLPFAWGTVAGGAAAVGGLAVASGQSGPSGGVTPEPEPGLDLQALAQAAEANTAAFSPAQYAQVGVVGVSAGNVDLVNSALNGAAVGAAQLGTVAELNEWVSLLDRKSVV